MLSSIELDLEVKEIGDRLLATKLDSTDSEIIYPCISHDLKHRIGIPRGLSVFDAMFSNNFSQHQTDSEGNFVLPNYIDPLLLNPILKYVSSKDPFFLLGSLPKTQNVFEMISLMDFLNIEPPEHDMNLDVIHSLLTNVHDYTERVCRKVYEHHKAPRHSARSTAVNFLFEFLSGKFNLNENKTRSKVFVKFEFIASHPKTFGCRIRHHMRSVALVKLNFAISKKQRNILNEWNNKFSHYGSVSDDDSNSSSDTFMTSSDEFYDSDYY